MPASIAAEWEDARTEAEAREIERRLRGLRLARAGLKWVGLPSFGATIALLVGPNLVAGFPSATSIGLLLALLAGAVPVLQSYLHLSEHVSELEAEQQRLIVRKRSVTAVLPSGETNR